MKADREHLDQTMRNLADILILHTTLKNQELEVAADAADRLDSRGAPDFHNGRALAQSLRQAHRQSGRTTNQFLKALGPRD